MLTKEDLQKMLEANAQAVLDKNHRATTANGVSEVELSKLTNVRTPDIDVEAIEVGDHFVVPGNVKVIEDRTRGGNTVIRSANVPTWKVDASGNKSAIVVKTVFFPSTFAKRRFPYEQNGATIQRVVNANAYKAHGTACSAYQAKNSMKESIEAIVDQEMVVSSRDTFNGRSFQGNELIEDFVNVIDFA